jgi:tetratricopeptide (TPR) repeat protein
MSCRIGSFLLLFALPVIAAGSSWSNTRYGVAIDSFPDGWKVRSGDSQVRLEKVLNEDGYGYAYDESLTFAITIGESVSMESTAEELSALGYLIQERNRVQLGEGTVPLWIFFHQANAQEVSWLAVVLRAGLTYTFEVRGTPMDRGLLADFKAVVNAFHFLPDSRQDAWNALEGKDVRRAFGLFQRLVSAQPADGNALYGLGLSELALGRSRDALAHLKQAGGIIGLDELRPALAQAYLQSGDPLRAAALWYQTIEEDPEREDELEPDIAGAVAQARVSDHAVTAEHELVWEDFELFADLVMIDLQDSLMDARSGDFDPRSLAMWEKAEEGGRRLFPALLEHLLVEGGSEVETHYLAAAFGSQQAIRRAIYGLRNSDLVVMEEAGLRLHEAMATFLTGSPHPQ